MLISNHIVHNLDEIKAFNIHKLDANEKIFNRLCQLLKFQVSFLIANNTSILAEVNTGSKVFEFEACSWNEAIYLVESQI